jgi:uncharacterized protein involved in outer membrane biogenesis
MLGLAIFLAFILLFALSLTWSKIATPVVNKGLDWWGPENSRVDRARLRFPQLLILSVEEGDIGDYGGISTADLNYNPFGFIPGLAWLPNIEGQQGRFVIPPRAPEAEPFALDIRKIINNVELSNVDIVFTDRQQERRVLAISSATGSIHFGNIAVSAMGGGATIQITGARDETNADMLGGALRIRGDNVKDIAAFAGLAAPDTPPYDLSINYSLAGKRADLDIQQGTVGDSDISGPMTVNFAGDVPDLDANLSSQNLDLDDLGIVFGIPVGTGEGETVGEEQQKAKQAFEQSNRMIPNVEIDFNRLDSLNGRIRYKAQSVKAAAVNMTGLALDINIDGRLVEARQIEATFPQGQLQAYVTLDAGQSPAKADVKGNLDNITMEALALSGLAQGNIEGDFKFTTYGNNFRDAAASATGDIALWSTDFRLISIGSELAGLDLGEAFMLLLAEEEKTDFTPARCVAFVAQLEEGIANIEPGVIDTADSLILLDGGFNLGNEAINVDVRADAKDASIGSLFGDISLGGSFRDPSVSVISEETILQAGLTALLGALTGPLAALPFIDTGDANNAPCGSLMARAQAAADTPPAQ